MIFAELEQYAESKFGPGTWKTLLKKANLENRIYLAVQEYPDSEAVSLVMAASAATGQPVSSVLEDFGRFIVPSLLRLYGHLLKPEWRTLDVIENTERTVHAVVRVRNPGAKPPQLKTRRIGPKEVSLLYNSPRRLCGLAIGIASGLGEHFHENIVANQRICMYKGADHCEIRFTKLD
jgi:Haem-NO-binding